MDMLGNARQDMALNGMYGAGQGVSGASTQGSNAPQGSNKGASSP